MLEEKTLAGLKGTLFAGQYNLLLGSGVSLDSLDHSGKPIIGTEHLRQMLCAHKGVKEGWPLSRVYPLLSAEEKKLHLTNRFFGCQPGPTVSAITSFVWQQVFTLNIDDALEAAYQANSRRKQQPIPLNFDRPFETFSNRYNIPIVHLHGFAREPEKEYVFSITEYAQVMRNLNPWMHVLSELLATEPFIIAGTSLTEPDLEYYLSTRRPASPRVNRGPSILIEPDPDQVTVNDCERHGLVLVRGTLREFLDWIHKELGEAPSLYQLCLPPIEKLFSPEPEKIRQVAFFSCFDLVRPMDAPAGTTDLSGFYYGRPPSWHDLAASVDIPIDDEFRIATKVKEFLDGVGESRSAIVVLDSPGAGKTTSVRRVAYDLAREGRIVFSLKSTASIDTDNAVACIGRITKPYVLLVDGLADHATAVRSLMENADLVVPFVVLGAEREYRREHIDRVLEGVTVDYLEPQGWSEGERLQLIERYRKKGLLGSQDALKNPNIFATRLASDPIAIAVCRILNDFRPLYAIAKSIWNHADEYARRSYLIAGLTHYCHPVGIFYPLLQASYENPALSEQLGRAHPLPMCYAPDNDDYVIPLNASVAYAVLHLVEKEKRELLLEAFVKLGNALAPYVNRRTIIQQTPEARLAGRLFDCDKVVRPLLNDMAERLYVEVKERWEWNSRYWEQRALLIQDSDPSTAIQYARHAVAIEQHPFPWTTLASLLVKRMDSDPGNRDALFGEAYETLMKVFQISPPNWRHSAHSYVVLFNGAIKLLSLGGTLTPKQKRTVVTHLNDARYAFKRDVSVQTLCQYLEDMLGAMG